jgi:hypothetical protein
MKIQEWSRAFNGLVFSFVLVLLMSGCGGVSSSGDNPPSDGGSPVVSNTPVAGLLLHADAGNIIGVRVNETATLDGSASSANSPGPLTYDWSILSTPDSSQAVLQNATSAHPSFVPDVAGTYRVQLVVSSQGVESQRVIGFVEASVAGNYTGDKRVHTSYPATCADCHDGHLAQGDGVVGAVVGKSGNHLATSNVCEACHTTFGFDRIQYVDHREVIGKCSSCHNGVLANGKSPFHVATNAECDDCHTTVSFLTLDANGRYDHSSITHDCVRCHNGTTAIGKPDTHIPTPPDSDCASCHTTDDFKNGYVDHSTITGNCASCHNGTDALGPKLGHPVMAVDCGVCHNTSTFSLGGVFNHRVVDPAVQPCAGCHNDNNSINARGKASAANHVETTEDCGVCHGVGGGSFANGVFDHTGIVANCGNCHGDSGNGSGMGKPVNHIPTNEDCSICHTPGTFATGVFTHNPIIVDPIACSTCHNNVNTIGKFDNHIPTSEDCRACHLNTDTFLGAVFDHTGITNNCASCHDGKISTGMSANHLPTDRDCSDCHFAFDSFAGATYDHLGVTNKCATCHNGVIAMGKKVNHIPAQNECSLCHQNTTVGGFATSTFLSDVHPSIATGCEGCHNTKIFLTTPAAVKPATHIPTTQDCHVCHTNVAFTPQIFNHTGIADNCASCHDGNYAATANALGKPANHIVTSSDCGVCHAIGGSFLDGVFDHTGRVDNCSECHGDGAPGTAMKKPANHVQTTQDCSVCHVPGSFATSVFNHDGIVDNCASCHDGPTATATTKSINHIPTTEDCSVCHNTTAFAGARFDHTGIVDNCATCHDGTIATGKNGTHVPTNEDCSVCHQTTGFIPATFSHAGIVDNCQFCHDGSLAQGKPSGHILTNQDCGVCHNTDSFTSATFDHSSVSDSTRCDSCHGVTAIGKDAKTNPPHIQTTLDCRECHTTATFVGGTWVHDASTAGNCDSCHDGVIATTKPATGHISTDLQCDTCHSTDAWAPTSFSHDPQGNYPGDHRRSLTCGSCHGSVVTTPFVYPYPQYAPYCAACHAGNFRSRRNHNGGTSGTVEQNKDCSGGGRCHSVRDSDF